MENALRATVHQIDPQVPLDHIQSMEHAVAGSEAPRRFNTILISCFALVAVLLSVLGIYSIIAFSVALREQEMALRMALGCQRSGVLALILASGIKLAAVGCALGLLGALPRPAYYVLSCLTSAHSIRSCFHLLPSPCCCWRSAPGTTGQTGRQY